MVPPKTMQSLVLSGSYTEGPQFLSIKKSLTYVLFQGMVMPRRAMYAVITVLPYIAEKETKEVNRHRMKS